MATTWGELETAIRVSIGDPAGDSQRYAEAELLEYVKDAIRDYSVQFPVFTRLEITELTVAPVSFAIPDDCLSIIGVEVGWGGRLKCWVPKNEPYAQTSGMPPAFYYIEGDTIYLNGDPGAKTTYLLYRRARALPAESADVIEAPDTDLDLITAFAMARCQLRIALQAAPIDRWREDGRRDDNPLLEPYKELMALYRRAISERKGLSSWRLA
jgi:hypothetical protein